ncbi:BnaA04g06020D [Brassica napus]|uniref:BnaA04g06020D protein n=1 Tax=Brassica napus TaxID=3708 RepID=A0A078GDN8_BRANA|nr:BnaA04g06020D [Brassica napus]
MGNSISNSQNDQTSPVKRDVSIERAEKEKQCECLHAKMQECMETHSDYYHPIFAAAREAGDKAIHREVQAFIIPSSVGRDLKEWS